jgi:NAD(P)-dependent dehydrogenase (short-subunit alcohol dehydrogenase family)
VRLEGKVALITGAASGIGLGALELFVAEGARVVAADVQDDKGAALEMRFKGQVKYAHCDVTREADIAAAVAAVQGAFGGLDVLFNNAGAGGEIAGVGAITVEGWDRTFALLVRAVALGMKHALPAMVARGGGSVINTASIAGMQAGFGPYAYSVCKGAVIHMTRCAAAELARQKVRVNAICPGVIATSIIGNIFGMPIAQADQLAAQVAANAAACQAIEKPGLPHDIAEAALFLASDASAFVTGHSLVVDGGITMGHPSSWDADAPNFLGALGLTPEQLQQAGYAR